MTWYGKHPTNSAMSYMARVHVVISTRNQKKSVSGELAVLSPRVICSVLVKTRRMHHSVTEFQSERGRLIVEELHSAS